MKNKGITLMALVITVIVLLILAGVSITLVIGDNGILNKATVAKRNTVLNGTKEQISLAISSANVSGEGVISYDNLVKELNNQFGENGYTISDEDEDEWLITVTTSEGDVTETVTNSFSKKIFTTVCSNGTLLFSNNENDLSKYLTNNGLTIENGYEIKNIFKDNYSVSAENYPTWANDTNITHVEILNEITPKSTSCWFYYLENLIEINGLNNINTINTTDMSGMFAGCSSLTSLDVSTFNTQNVTNMSYMFAGSCKLDHGPADGRVFAEKYDGNIQSLALNTFDTSNVTNMSYMFAYQVSLSDLDLSSFDTSNVTNMGSMFRACPSLVTIDLKNFNTANVTNMSGMFSCLRTSIDGQYTYNGNQSRTSSLRTIYVSDLWTTANVNQQNSYASKMFRDCSSLTGAISYDSNKIDLTYANYQTGYLTFRSNH